MNKGIRKNKTLEKKSDVTEQKVTEWEITKTGVVNEIEIFIVLNKFNTHQQREEGTHC